MEQEFEKVDFTGSIDRTKTMQHHLWTNYQVTFLEAHIKKYLPKLTKSDRIKKAEEEK